MTTKTTKTKAAIASQLNAKKQVSAGVIANPVKIHDVRVESSGSDFTQKAKLRQIGNSQGVILSNQLIRAAGINKEADLIVRAHDGAIMITEMKSAEVNTDLSTWDAQFKTAIKQGDVPEIDSFEGMGNEFDKNEW